MSTRRFGSFADDWSAEFKDPNNWLPVSCADFSIKNRKIYLKRKRAIDLYLACEMTNREIAENTGVSKSELYRLLERAFEARADGQPVGYLACVPNFRLKDYERTSTKNTNRSGRMGLFLSTNPEIKEKLDDWALGRKPMGQSKLRGKGIKPLWLKVVRECKLVGIDTENEYPFTNSDGGREAIRNYVKKLRQSDFVLSASVEHGDGSGRLARENGVNVPTTTNLPYDRVQLDGHRIDAIFVITIIGADGNEVELPLSRIWLLVLIDVGSRCVLGYHLSLSENYTSEDVLSCIASSLVPWKQKELPDNFNGYRKDAGLPSGVIDECQWRIFNTLQFDNAMSHQSAWVQERVINAGAIEVVTNKPASPRSDGIVERFMKTVEETSMHQWPNTTGSSATDPRRKNPEKAAIKLRLGVDELDIAIDLTIADYNVTAHTSLQGRSPMEYLRYRLHKGADLVRYSTKKSLEGLSLFDRDKQVTIRANLKQGHKPYVKFLNVRYTEDWLRSRYDLNGVKAILRFNIQDIRTVQLFLLSGECLGTISADAAWMELKHSISTRRAIFKLIRANKLVSDSFTPVSDYLDLLAQEAPLSRKARNKYLKGKNDSPESTEPKKKVKTEEKQIIPKRSKTNWVSLTETVSR